MELSLSRPCRACGPWARLPGAALHPPPLRVGGLALPQTVLAQPYGLMSCRVGRSDVCNAPPCSYPLNPVRRRLVTRPDDWPQPSAPAWSTGVDEPLRIDRDSLPPLELTKPWEV